MTLQKKKMYVYTQQAYNEKKENNSKINNVENKLMFRKKFVLVHETTWCKSRTRVNNENDKC